MKVTFTCEKCGFLFSERVYEGEIADFAINKTDWIMNEMSVHPMGKHWVCPNCAKLTYGPLTEEMVAEALYEAGQSDWGNITYAQLAQNGGRTDYYERQSRFVLRLLKEYNEGTFPGHFGLSREPARRRLLDLAREV